MYVIKMEADKYLHPTVTSTIYQGERNADVLLFLIPKTYQSVDMADCSMLLRYILPDGTGRSEYLKMYPLPYNDDYYQFKLSVSTRFTENSGKIELWLTAINMNDDIVLRTSSTVVKITPSKNITEYLPPKDLNQLDVLSAKVNHLEQSKADDLTYDIDEKLLQLTSNGVSIGIPVDMKDMVNEDDVIEFGDDVNVVEGEKVIYF